MRSNFSTFEKEIMIKICKSENNRTSLSHLFDENFSAIEIELTEKLNKYTLLWDRVATVLYNSEVEDKYNWEKIDYYQDKIIEITTFLKELETEGYIITYKRCDSVMNNCVINRIDKNRHSTDTKVIPDSNITDLLFEYHGREIRAKENLIELVNNNYLTEEERRYREQTKINRFAVGVAIAATFTSSFFGWLSIKEANEQENRMRQEKEQRIEIMEKLDNNLSVLVREMSGIEKKLKYYEIILNNKFSKKGS